MSLEKIINYVVGGKPGENKGVPVNVRLSLDPDFKKTILKSVIILGASIAVGTGSGIVISDGIRNRRRKRS